MTRRTLSPEDRRAELLVAARAVFVEKGYQRTGIGDIVGRVGCARGTFYNYFDSKRAVFSIIVTSMMEEVVGVIEPIDVTTDIATQVRANLERIIRAVASADVARVLFVEAGGIDEDGDAALRDFYGDATGRIEVALRTGQALGVVRPGDVRILACCLLGLIKEPVVQASLRGETLDVDVLVEQIVALMVGGLLRG